MLGWQLGGSPSRIMWSCVDYQVFGVWSHSLGKVYSEWCSSIPVIVQCTAIIPHTTDWLFQVHLVSGICGDTPSAERARHAERRTGWKPEHTDCLWAEQIHPGAEDWEENCELTNKQTQTNTHTGAEDWGKLWVVSLLSFTFFRIKISRDLRAGYM